MLRIILTVSLQLWLQPGPFIIVWELQTPTPRLDIEEHGHKVELWVPWCSSGWRAWEVSGSFDLSLAFCTLVLGGFGFPEVEPDVATGQTADVSSIALVLHYYPSSCLLSQH